MAVDGAFEILPNQKLVTLSPRNPTASDISIRAVRRPWTQQEANRWGEGVPNTGPEKASFMLPKTDATGTAVVPRTDWLLTDADANIWTILQVARELEGEIFRCLVIKQV